MGNSATQSDHGTIDRLRLEKLRGVLNEQALDLLLCYCSRSDSRYSIWLAGTPCTSSFHYFFLTRERHAFLEVSYRAADLRQRSGATVLTFADEDKAPEAVATLSAAAKRIGVAGPAPFNHFLGLTSSLVDVSGAVDGLLTIKNQHEIDALALAAGKLLAGMRRCGEAARIGSSEREIAAALRAALLTIGEQLPFSPTVRTGAGLRSATVGTPGPTVIEASSALLIDAGVTVNGLVTDCTRMFFQKGSPLEDPYRRLCAAQQKVISSIRSGVALGDVIAHLRRELKNEKLPFETLEIADLGHGLGFALHEAPFVGRPEVDSVVLEPGMVLTLEPELSLPAGRIRCEDMIAIGPVAAQILTAEPS